MKILSDILYKCDLLGISGSSGIEIKGLALDSRKVEAGFAFAAIRGLNSDGHDFIAAAIEKGAVAVLCNEIPANPLAEITYIRVKDVASALARVAANFYDNPSEKIKVVGVTGTNGKTTIATLLFKLFTNAGHKAALLSTISNIIGNDAVNAVYTTPDAIELNRLFAEMVQKGCEYCFMEVSSHAIHQRRVEHVQFSGSIFTNLTHDHLDYHKTFREYLLAKKTLFDSLNKSAFAITNNDDKNGQVMLQNSKARKFSYGLRNMADYKGKVIENLLTGLVMNIDGREVFCRLVGEFNASNIMAIYACSRQLGMEPDLALTQISALSPVEGRFDYFIGRDSITGIVDYAHTPDALENVLKTIQDLRKGNERIISVVGCGGNRDAEKRPAMAAIAVSLSDQVVLTSDNPRHEDPQKILADMIKGVEPAGVRRTVIIESRKEAIKAAVAMANPGDLVLVAGKGHEKYQEIKGVRYPFDDLQILKETLT